MLSLALAMEKLFGPMEPPSLVAGCAGCTVNTSAVPVGAACACTPRYEQGTVALALPDGTMGGSRAQQAGLHERSAATSREHTCCFVETDMLLVVCQAGVSRCPCVLKCLLTRQQQAQAECSCLFSSGNCPH